MNCSELCDGLRVTAEALAAGTCAECASWNATARLANDTANNTNVNKFYFYEVSSAATVAAPVVPSDLYSAV